MFTCNTHWSKGTNMILAFFIYLFKITFWQKGCLRQLKILKIYYQWSQVQLGLISLGPFFISSKLTSAIEIYGFRWIRSKMPNIQPAAACPQPRYQPYQMGRLFDLGPMWSSGLEVFSIPITLVCWWNFFALVLKRHHISPNYIRFGHFSLHMKK